MRCTRIVHVQYNYRNYTHKKVVDKYKRVSGDGVEKIKINPTDESHLQRRLFVLNIPLHATWKDLKDHFKPVGAKFVSISKDQVTGESKGCGIVQFDDASLLDEAVTRMHGTMLLGSNLAVRRDLKIGNSATPISSIGRAQPVAENERKGARGQSTKQYWEGIYDEPRPFPKRSDKIPNISVIHSEINAEVNRDKIQKRSKPFQMKRDPRDEVYIEPTELARIESLLTKREEHRFNKNYDFADSLQVTLRNQHRVYCEDADGLWRILSPQKSNGSARRDNMKLRGQSYPNNKSNKSRTEY